MKVTTSAVLGRRNADGSKRIRLKCIVLGAAGAGKTSIIRRYFNNTFSESRVPTLGSDFYTGRVPNPVYKSPEEQGGGGSDEKKDSSHEHEWVDKITRQPYFSVQVWDTAGRERFSEQRTILYTAAYSDEFFQQADACMLVYDATSSTSFTQLLKWHSDLMERLKKTSQHKLPVLIVANKMDIFKRNIAEPKRSVTVPQRDVLGLRGSFRGKDSRYEYRASPQIISDNDKKQNHNRRFEISTYMTTGDSTWTTDGSYLDSVLNTEDSSHPDRDMVLLWCMRNGLKHVELSALDGK